MVDLKTYEEKINIMTTRDLLDERLKILAKIKEVMVVDRHLNKAYIVNAYLNKKFQLRLRYRKELADQTKTINSIIKSNNMDFSDAWYTIYGHFVASDRKFYKADKEFNKKWSESKTLLDVLNNKCLKVIKRYFKDFIKNTKTMGFVESAKKAHKDMLLRGFYETDIKYLLSLPENWETIYDNVQRIKFVDKSIKNREIPEDVLQEEKQEAKKRFIKRVTALAEKRENKANADIKKQELLKIDQQKHYGSSKEDEFLIFNKDGSTSLKI